MARTAGEQLSWGLVGALTLAALLQPGGCGGGPSGDTPPEDALVALLEDTWPEVVEPALDRSAAEADALVAAAEAWAAAEASDGDVDGARAEAQVAWWSLMAAWQEVELLQIGPAASSVSLAVGGADLRDEVYSWPTTNRCRVDQETVAGGWTAPDFFGANLVNTYGLDALETVLFSPAGENDCPPQVDINSSGDWDALGVDGVQQARADFAVALAVGVRDVIDEIDAAWDPEAGDWAGELARAGDGTSAYESADVALNAIYDALFYIETRTKDRKLAGPLGLRDCGLPDCLAEVETRLAGGSHEWIAANLVGFRTLFTGGDGAGMEDLLRSLDHGALADDVIAALDAADAAAAALTIPVDEAVASDPEPALAVHAALTDLTDLLKGDVATVLTMQIPSEAAGDAD